MWKATAALCENGYATVARQMVAFHRSISSVYQVLYERYCSVHCWSGLPQQRGDASELRLSASVCVFELHTGGNATDATTERNDAKERYLFGYLVEYRAVIALHKIRQTRSANSCYWCANSTSNKRI